MKGKRETQMRKMGKRFLSDNKGMFEEMWILSEPTTVSPPSLEKCQTHVNSLKVPYVIGVLKLPERWQFLYSLRIRAF